MYYRNRFFLVNSFLRACPNYQYICKGITSNELHIFGKNVFCSLSELLDPGVIKLYESIVSFGAMKRHESMNRIEKLLVTCFEN